MIAALKQGEVARQQMHIQMAAKETARKGAEERLIKTMDELDATKKTSLDSEAEHVLELAKLKKKSGKKSSAKKSSSTASAAAKKEEEKHTAEINALSNAAAAAREDALGTREELKEAQETIKTLKAEAVKQRSELSEAKAKVAQLNGNVRSLEAQTVKALATQTRAQLKEETAKDHEVIKMKAKVENADAAKEKLAALQSEVSMVKAENQEARKMLDGWKSAYETKVADHEREVEKLKDELKQRVETIDKLNGDLLVVGEMSKDREAELNAQMMGQ
eukprot:gene1775-31386_t